MKYHSPWIFLILPLVIAYPADENKPIESSNNESLPAIAPKRTSFELLNDYNVQDLQNRPPTRFKRTACECQSQLEKKLRENTIDLIVLYIYAGNYSAAYAKFLEINEKTLTNTIIEKMVSNPNYENVLKFIKTLEYLSYRMVGYEAMIKKTNLSFSIFTLEQDLNDLLGLKLDPDTVRNNQHLIDFVRKNLNEKIKVNIASMVVRIMTKQPAYYNDLIKYSENQQKAFNPHLEELVEKCYQYTDSDVDTIEQILAFSNALTQIGQSARVYIKLYKLMERAKEFIFPSFVKIAFKVKELMLMINYKNTAEEIKKQTEELKEKMPLVVKSIIWGQVCIKQEKMGKFLHVNGAYNSKRRSIILAPDHDRWVFESNDDANSFKIRHVKTNEYMYAENDEFAYSAFKRRLFTWSKNNSELVNQFWLLEDLKWRQGKFFIKNKKFDEYLNGEEVLGQVSTVGNITHELDAISKKDAELARKIQQCLGSNGSTDRLQAFTWRRTSRGNQPEWLILSESNC